MNQSVQISIPINLRPHCLATAPVVIVFNASTQLPFIIVQGCMQYLFHLRRILNWIIAGCLNSELTNFFCNIFNTMFVRLSTFINLLYSIINTICPSTHVIHTLRNVMR